MPSLDYRRLRAAVSMRQVLELIQFEPRQRSGDEWRGRCPLHGSTSGRGRTFAANVKKNAFHCFKCGARGNQLDLWTKLSKLPLNPAAMALCQAAGIDPPLLPRLQKKSRLTP